nr:GNAT family N-acetyltransferase [Alphaproteobacteria bacterium]
AFSDPRFDVFMERMATTNTHRAECVVTAVSFDDTLIAGEIGFVNKDTYVSHVAAYDVTHARLSPGVLQFEDTIAACFDRGIKTIDLLAPSDPYKSQWASGSVDVYDFAVPLTAKGYVVAAVKSAWVQSALRAGVRILPQRLQQVVARVA